MLVRVIVLALFLLLLSTAAIASQTLRLPNGRSMTVCDNIVVRDIPGGAKAIWMKGKEYLESMRNNTRKPFDKFQQKWKGEIDRVRMPMLPSCHHLTVFGDEKANYDEAKRFCYVPLSSPSAVEEQKQTVAAATTTSSHGPCVTYSIGSNNKWDFEEHMFRVTNCRIETFDCTVDATVPPHIHNRTRFHSFCLGSKSGKIDQQTYMTLPQLNAKAGRNQGPDYFKIDIEGFEWSVLKSLVNDVYNNPKLDAHLPLQIYGEFHLDLDKDVTSDQHWLAALEAVKNIFIRCDTFTCSIKYNIFAITNSDSSLIG